MAIGCIHSVFNEDKVRGRRRVEAQTACHVAWSRCRDGTIETAVASMWKRPIQPLKEFAMPEPLCVAMLDSKCAAGTDRTTNNGNMHWLARHQPVQHV